MRDFFEGKVKLHCFNHSSLVLIPNKDDPDSIGDYMPINLSNCVYKIAIKVHSASLVKVINIAVVSSQSMFVCDRLILDSMVSAQESIFSLKKRRH